MTSTGTTLKDIYPELFDPEHPAQGTSKVEPTEEVIFFTKEEPSPVFSPGHRSWLVTDMGHVVIDHTNRDPSRFTGYHLSATVKHLEDRVRATHNPDLRAMLDVLYNCQKTAKERNPLYGKNLAARRRKNLINS